MESVKVVERTCGLDNLVAATQWLDGVFGEHQWIQLRVDAVGVVAFNE